MTSPTDSPRRDGESPTDGTSASLHLRPLEASDLPFADRLRAMEGWNQTPDDWRRLATTPPGQAWVAERGGSPVGTLAAAVYGGGIGWLGMLLVAAGSRGQGVGSSLLARGIEWLQKREIQRIGLDATQLGMPLYSRFGFVEEWRLTRWKLLPPGPPVEGGPAVTQMTRRDLEEAAEMDEHAFGARRPGLLEALLCRSAPGQALVARADSGPMEGFGMLRPGARAPYIGPVVASTPKRGAHLVRELIGRSRPAEYYYWDCPNEFDPRMLGGEAWPLVRERELVRMTLSRVPEPGQRALGIPRMLIGIAGPESG